jgi:hypothetical protein
MILKFTFGLASHPSSLLAANALTSQKPHAFFNNIKKFLFSAELAKDENDCTFDWPKIR